MASPPRTIRHLREVAALAGTGSLVSIHVMDGEEVEDGMDDGWDSDGDVASWIGGSRGSGADGGAGESVRVCFDCAQFTAQHPKKEMN